jgi:hypothetical protein
MLIVHGSGGGGSGGGGGGGCTVVVGDYSGGWGTSSRGQSGRGAERRC